MSTTDNLEESLLAYLEQFHKGEKNAVFSKKLEMVFFLTSRQIRGVVSRLQLQNQPICSSNNGYFYSENPKEIIRYVCHLRQRYSEISAVTKGLENSIKNLKRGE